MIMLNMKIHEQLMYIYLHVWAYSQNITSGTMYIHLNDNTKYKDNLYTQYVQLWAYSQRRTMILREAYSDTPSPPSLDFLGCHPSSDDEESYCLALLDLRRLDVSSCPCLVRCSGLERS